jgi:hypothetical protein
LFVGDAAHLLSAVRIEMGWGLYLLGEILNRKSKVPDELLTELLRLLRRKREIFEKIILLGNRLLNFSQVRMHKCT